jgi:chorismate synthase
MSGPGAGERMDSAGERLDDGVVPRVGQVLQQVVQGALAGHVVLDQETQEREHSQPPWNNNRTAGN